MYKYNVLNFYKLFIYNNNNLISQEKIMAERIVSPGVFTREKDLSFLPQGVAEIGAAIVGPTERGPAFTPTVITSNSEFESIFGAQGGKVPFYAGLAAK